MIELWRAQPFPKDVDCGYVERHEVTEKEMKQIKKGKPIRNEYSARVVDKDACGYFTDFDDAKEALLFLVDSRVERAEHEARIAICHLVDQKDFRYRTQDVYR